MYLMNSMQAFVCASESFEETTKPVPPDMLLGIRRDETLSAALSGGGLEPESPGGSATSAALSGVADLYSDKNIVDAGLPFVEMVYLFDSRGTMGEPWV